MFLSEFHKVFLRYWLFRVISRLPVNWTAKHKCTFEISGYFAPSLSLHFLWTVLIKRTENVKRRKDELCSLLQNMKWNRLWELNKEEVIMRTDLHRNWGRKISDRQAIFFCNRHCAKRNSGRAWVYTAKCTAADRKNWWGSSNYSKPVVFHKESYKSLDFDRCSGCWVTSWMSKRKRAKKPIKRWTKIVSKPFQKSRWKYSVASSQCTHNSNVNITSSRTHHEEADVPAIATIIQ